MPTATDGTDPDKGSPTSIQPGKEGSQSGYNNTNNFAGIKGWKMSVKTAYKFTPGSVSWLCSGGSWWAAVGIKSNVVVGAKTGINVGGQFGFSVKKVSYSNNFLGINVQKCTVKGQETALKALNQEAIITSWEDFVSKLDTETETAILMSQNMALRSNEVKIAENQIDSAVAKNTQGLNRLEAITSELVTGGNHINNKSLEMKAVTSASEVLTNKVKTTTISMLAANLTTFA
ncbi:hypothetical protein [Shewanella surugensis]|uniref:Uncharacterized protein n=1 Tax=Shewanella surugensis TaxID=212020 RepID=A0ABT0LE42_9GAMM|nr:hypothetical protein [Shewanella surugensis]MCL1125974.1 hypothetical protein [Shewanella surugensis]